MLNAPEIENDEADEQIRKCLDDYSCYAEIVPPGKHSIVLRMGSGIDRNYLFKNVLVEASTQDYVAMKV